MRPTAFALPAFRLPAFTLTACCLTAFALTLTLSARPVLAEEPDPPLSELGTQNPEELSINRVLDDVAQGKTSMTHCATGYLITKSGRHAEAREVFERCAADGWTGAMTWMSQLDENGLGAAQDVRRAAEWDRRAAEAGDPVGKFNHGLDLLRGRGVPRDPAAGRALIDEAAQDGLATAQTLKDAGYDPRAVTPDADEWRYETLY